MDRQQECQANDSGDENRGFPAHSRSLELFMAKVLLQNDRVMSKNNLVIDQSLASIKDTRAAIANFWDKFPERAAKYMQQSGRSGKR